MCTSQKFVCGSGLLLKVGLNRIMSCAPVFLSSAQRMKDALICTLGHRKYNAWHKHCCLRMMTACNWMAAVSSHLIGAHGNMFRHTQWSPILVWCRVTEMNLVQILFEWASYNTHLYYPQFITTHSNCHFTCMLETWFMCNKGTLHAMKACKGVDKYLYSSLTSAWERQVVSLCPDQFTPMRSTLIPFGQPARWAPQTVHMLWRRQKISNPCQESSHNSCHTTHSLSTILITIAWFPICVINFVILTVLRILNIWSVL